MAASWRRGASTLNPKINAAVIYYGTESMAALARAAKRFPASAHSPWRCDQIIPGGCWERDLGGGKRSLLGGPCRTFVNLSPV